MSTFELSFSARPFVTRGTALAMPPDPVSVPTPVPGRSHQVSIVKAEAPSPGAAPNVTCCDDPLNCRPVFPEGGGPSSAGAPETHVGPPVVVPLIPPTAPATDVPAPSFIPQRPIRPVPEVSSEFMEFALWVSVPAELQLRASPGTPAKKPDATPVEFIAVASAACWI